MLPLIASIFICSACSYRFTNLSTEVPQELRSISFEAIYDTSRTVLPHQHLWEELQRAFAADGHLLVRSQGRADAVLRAHILSASVGPTGRAEANGLTKDQEKYRKPAPKPNQFRDLNLAGEYTQEELIQVAIDIEVINLYTKKVLFTKRYAGAEKFRSLHKVQGSSQYLLYDEALSFSFRKISRNIAQNVVRDFIVGR